MKKIYVFLVLACAFNSFSQLVYKDVASVFYARCTSCHHDGASNYPFMNYSQTSSMSGAIYADLISGVMPPWNADTSYTRFQHERIITASEKQKILDWINDGSLAGDTTQAPIAPVYNDGFQLAGNADLTLSIGTFTSGATTADKYYCFSLPSGLTQDRIIRAYEIVPGNPAIVHHAVITADTTGTYVSNLSGSCYNIPGNMSIGTYAPGAKATIFPSQTPLKAGMRLKAGSKVILQIHYPAGSAGLVDSTKIRLFFYPAGTSGIRTIYSATPLQNWSMNILANTTATYSAYYPSSSSSLPVALSAFAVMPHSHLLCKSIVYYAIKPGIDTIKLVRINDWNFEWQDYYVFKQLVKIPAGYKLYSKHVYDNTASNPNQPNNPPINVVSGTGTNDEMLFDGMMYLYYLPGDELIDIQAIIDSDPLLTTDIKSINKADLKAIAVPNPFSSEVSIHYLLNEETSIDIEILDVMGRKVIEHHKSKEEAGVHTWSWAGTDLNGNELVAGVYFYKIKTRNQIAEGKIIKQ